MWHFWGLSAIEVHYVQGYHLSLLIDVKKMKKNILHFMQIISRNCSWHDTKLHHVAASHPLRLKRKLSPNSSRNMLIPCALFQLMDIYFLEGRGSEGKWERVAAAVVAVEEGWRSVVTLHVPVCTRLHSWLSSHLTGLSVSTADQDASLSLTGWTDSAAIQTDSSSGSCWRKGGLR